MFDKFVRKIGQYAQIKPSISMLIQLVVIYPSAIKIEYNHNISLMISEYVTAI